MLVNDNALSHQINLKKASKKMNTKKASFIFRFEKPKIRDLPFSFAFNEFKEPAFRFKIVACLNWWVFHRPS